MEVSKDIPNEEFDSIPLQEWIETFWRSPLLDDDASLAAYVDGELAGVTMIRIDRPSGRAQNNLAGVRRTFRGRGLAVLLKSHSLRRAAELGATIAITDNDETNAPMLAVNTKLGYEPFARRIGGGGAGGEPSPPRWEAGLVNPDGCPGGRRVGSHGESGRRRS